MPSRGALFGFSHSCDDPNTTCALVCSQIAWSAELNIEGIPAMKMETWNVKRALEEKVHRIRTIPSLTGPKAIVQTIGEVLTSDH